MRTKSSKEMTIVDVAKEAGVSIATVSRVMNGTAKVAQAKKDAVYEAMKRLDYAPNEAARSLPKVASRNITVIVPQENDLFKMEILSGLIDAAELNDNTINLLNPVPLSDASDDELWFKLKQLRTSGVVVLDNKETTRTNLILKNLDIPLIYMNQAPMDHENVFTVKMSITSFAHAMTTLCKEENIHEVQLIGLSSLSEVDANKIISALENADIQNNETAKTIVALNDQKLIESGKIESDSFIISMQGTHIISKLPNKIACNSGAAYHSGAYASTIIAKHQENKYIADEDKVAIKQVSKINSNLQRRDNVK